MPSVSLFDVDVLVKSHMELVGRVSGYSGSKVLHDLEVLLHGVLESISSRLSIAQLLLEQVVVELFLSGEGMLLLDIRVSHAPLCTAVVSGICHVYLSNTRGECGH